MSVITNLKGLTSKKIDKESWNMKIKCMIMLYLLPQFHFTLTLRQLPTSDWSWTFYEAIATKKNILCFSFCESFCVKYKAKVKIVPVQAKKVYRGRRFIVRLILQLDMRWTEVFTFYHSRFTPGGSARSLLNIQESLDMLHYTLLSKWEKTKRRASYGNLVETRKQLLCIYRGNCGI
jgi:hypothetical protein